MKNQVLNIKEMQEAIDMGIDTSKASMCWSRFKTDDDFSIQAMSKDMFEEQVREYDIMYTPCDYIIIPTFTLQDILGMLPIGYHIETDRHKNGYITYSIHQDWDNGQICWGNNLLKVAFNMLKWCKQHNVLNNEQKRLNPKKKLVPILECRWDCGTHCAMGHYGRCYSCNDFESKKVIKTN